MLILLCSLRLRLRSTYLIVKEMECELILMMRFELKLIMQGHFYQCPYMFLKECVCFQEKESCLIWCIGDMSLIRKYQLYNRERLHICKLLEDIEMEKGKVSEEVMNQFMNILNSIHYSFVDIDHFYFFEL